VAWSPFQSAFILARHFGPSGGSVDGVGYVLGEKHALEIIDYERRAKVGKVIGSGRMEKAVDLAVGMRQKKKGMSWSETGSHALALLKVVELNAEWDELWAAAA